MPTENSLPRRNFLASIASATAASATLTGASTLFPSVGRLAAAEASGKRADVEEVRLRADVRSRPYRIRMELDVKGNVRVPSSRASKGKEVSELPITSSALLDYSERSRFPDGAEPGPIVTAAERFYHEAKSESRVDRNEQTIRLRDSVRQTVVRRERLPETIYSPEDYFDHQELSLLEVPASSLAVDELLPAGRVREGSKYEIEGEAIRSLMNLSRIDSAEASGEIVSLSERDAKIRLEGSVEASVDGVPTKLRMVGKLTFDREQETCTWLAMAIHETREIGKAEPGFDIAATIKMLRKPLGDDEPTGLPNPPTKLVLTEPPPVDRRLVVVRSDEAGYSALMDRRWRMIHDIPGSARMRMIDRNRSVAQCDVRPLAVLPEGRYWTIEALEQELRRQVGSQLTEIVDSGEGSTETGLHGLQITANGAVEGVPVRWVVIHLADDFGRRIVATFTMDAASVDRFAGSDVQFANSLELTTTPGQTTWSRKADPEKTDSGGDEDGTDPGLQVSREKTSGERSASNGRGNDQLQSEGERR